MKNLEQQDKNKTNSDYIKNQMLEYKIWQDTCPVPIERLEIVSVPYVDFKGQKHDDGEIMVIDVAKDSVIKIFHTLFQMRFPINKIRLINQYNGNDSLSMADNNSSGFNHRLIDGSSNLSIHSYGLAIDLNPCQNPYVNFKDKEKGLAEISPPAAYKYLSRRKMLPGMVEPIVEIFAKNGFAIWGGEWNDPIDFHHFQTPRWVAKLISELSIEQGHLFWEIICIYRKEILSLDEDQIKNIFDNQKNYPDKTFELMEYICVGKNFFSKLIKPMH